MCPPCLLFHNVFKFYLKSPNLIWNRQIRFEIVKFDLKSPNSIWYCTEILMALWFYKVSFLKKTLIMQTWLWKFQNSNETLKKFLTHYVFGMKKTAAAALPEGKYHWTTFPHMHSGNSGWHLFSLVGFNWFYVVMFGTSPNLRTNNLGNYKFPLSAIQVRI